MRTSKAASTWKTILAHGGRISRLRSSQPWLQHLFIRQRLVNEAQGDLQDDCRITITQTLRLKTMAITTRTSTMLDIHSILTSRLSNRESKSLLKTTFSRSSKQKFVAAGKFQNANLAPNALLPTASTSCLPNNTFIKITEPSNARTSIKTCTAPTEIGASSTTI